MIKWIFENLDCKKLVIEGIGVIPRRSRLEWKQYKDEIEEVVIQDGIMMVSENLFADFKNLKVVTLPKTMKCIGKKAFYGCTSLKTIHHQSNEIRYIADKYFFSDPTRILFDEYAFFGVPWAIEKWDGYYVSKDALYTCFVDEKNLVIPEGVKTLSRYSLKGQDVNSIQLPVSLENIEDFAFFGTSIKQELVIPYKVKDISEKAFKKLKCRSVSIPSTFNVKNRYYQKTFITDSKVKIRKKYPEYKMEYSVVADKNECVYGSYRLKIRKNKPVTHKDGFVTKVMENEIRVADSLMLRLYNGKHIMCLRISNNTLESYKWFQFMPEYGEFKEYWLEPVKDENGEISADREVEDYLTTDAFYNSMSDHDGTLLYEKQELRLFNGDCYEEWYVSDFMDDHLDFVEEWINKHPKVKIK